MPAAIQRLNPEFLNADNPLTSGSHDLAHVFHFQPPGYPGEEHPAHMHSNS